MKRKTTNFLIIHCAATPPEMDIGVAEIRKWHTDPPKIVDGGNIGGNGWSDVGYHFVIRRSGGTETGRDIDRIGAHARGHNIDSIGICLVGGVDHRGKPDCNFTAAQWESLRRLYWTIRSAYPRIVAKGHRGVSARACPCFDVGAWVASA